MRDTDSDFLGDVLAYTGKVVSVEDKDRIEGLKKYDGRTHAGEAGDDGPRYRGVVEVVT